MVQRRYGLPAGKARFDNECPCHPWRSRHDAGASKTAFARISTVPHPYRPRRDIRRGGRGHERWSVFLKRRSRARFARARTRKITRPHRAPLHPRNDGDPSFTSPAHTAQGERERWCGRSESNRHSFRGNGILSPARLPVPPRPLGTPLIYCREGASKGDRPLPATASDRCFRPRAKACNRTGKSNFRGTFVASPRRP